MKLSDILEKFDKLVDSKKWYLKENGALVKDFLTKEDVKSFISTSIKEALESCIPTKSMRGNGEYGMGYDDCRDEMRNKLKDFLCEK